MIVRSFFLDEHEQKLLGFKFIPEVGHHSYMEFKDRKIYFSGIKWSFQ
jgi:hypothetical protein